MFFVNQRYEELPKELKLRVNEIHLLDRKIYELNKRNIKVDYFVIKYVVESCKIFFEFKDKVNRKILRYMEESLGEIPIMFFCIDNLKIDNNIKNIINPLVDLEDDSVLMKKEKVIKEIYKNLKKREIKLGKEKTSFRFDFNSIFDIKINNKELDKEINVIKGKYKELFNEGNKDDKLNKKSGTYFIDIINLYFKYKDKLIISILENSSFFFYLNNKKINKNLREEINEFINIKEYTNLDFILGIKLNKLKGDIE